VGSAVQWGENKSEEGMTTLTEGKSWGRVLVGGEKTALRKSLVLKGVSFRVKGWSRTSKAGRQTKKEKKNERNGDAEKRCGKLRKGGGEGGSNSTIYKRLKITTPGKMKRVQELRKDKEQRKRNQNGRVAKAF